VSRDVVVHEHVQRASREGQTGGNDSALDDGFASGRDRTSRDQQAAEREVMPRLRLDARNGSTVPDTEVAESVGVLGAGVVDADIHVQQSRAGTDAVEPVAGHATADNNRAFWKTAELVDIARKRVGRDFNGAVSGFLGLSVTDATSDGEVGGTASCNKGRHGSVFLLLRCGRAGEPTRHDAMVLEVV